MTTALLPTGFRDRLPPFADAAARLEAAALAAAYAYGYERADPALAEFEAGLAGRLKSARAQDAVRFVDPVSQATLAIRPDMTAQIGRIAATRMAHHPRPVRLSYAGPVLKLRASQLAPERELRQIGCELIGLDTVAAAREVVEVAVEALEAAGVTDISIDFTLPDLIDVLAGGPFPIDAAQIDALRDRLDAKDAGGVAGIAPAYLPLIEAAGPFETAHDRLCAFDARGALTSRLDALWKIAEGLKSRVALTLDPTERHGSNIRAGSASRSSRAACAARSGAAAPIRSCTKAAQKRPRSASRSTPMRSSRRGSPRSTGGGCSCRSAPRPKPRQRCARRAGSRLRHLRLAIRPRRSFARTCSRKVKRARSSRLWGGGGTPSRQPSFPRRRESIGAVSRHLPPSASMDPRLREDDGKLGLPLRA